MNSSISNSRQTSNVTSVKLYAEVVLKLGGCLLAAALLIYGYLFSVGSTGQGILERVTQARQALPKIIERPEHLVMFYGSSMIRAGVSPRQFDAKLAEQGKAIRSFNFGFGGLNPFFQDFLSRRIVEEFKQNDRRLKLVIIEFNPFQATQARWEGAESSVDSYLTLLASQQELTDIAKQDIERGARLFTIKYLRAGVSAEMITSYLAYGMFPPQRQQAYSDSESVVAEQRRLAQLLGEQFKKDYPNHNNAAWNYKWQGGGTIPEERSAKTLVLFEQYYDAMLTDAMMKNDRLGRIRSADIEELRFEPLLVDSFINTVNNFKDIADEVKVVMLPKNTKWIQTTRAADARLNETIRAIEQGTGIVIDDHQNLSVITPDMFSDTTHLARYRGDIVYTDYLLAQYGQLLN